MITVYGAAMSRAGRVLWTLEEIGIPYKREIVRSRSDEARNPAYRAINPSGKIPAMVDGDLVMTESLAMDLYLAETYGKGGLWPTAKADQAHCLQWTLWAATEVEPNISAVLYERFIKARLKLGEPDMQVIEASQERLPPALELLDAQLRDRDYVLGRFTVADINTAWIMEFFPRMSFDLAPYPNVKRWLAACIERPARKKVLAFAE